jgi:hypothetical protein
MVALGNCAEYSLEEFVPSTIFMALRGQPWSRSAEGLELGCILEQIGKGI